MLTGSLSLVTTARRSAPAQSLSLSVCSLSLFLSFVVRSPSRSRARSLRLRLLCVYRLVCRVCASDYIETQHFLPNSELKRICAPNQNQEQPTPTAARLCARMDGCVCVWQRKQYMHPDWKIIKRKRQHNRQLADSIATITLLCTSISFGKFELKHQ